MQMRFFLFQIILLFLVKIIRSQSCDDPNNFCVGNGESYSTIQEAIDAVTSPGQKIYIKGGNYTTSFTTSGKAAGTKDQPIEILPFHQEIVTLIHDDSSQIYLFSAEADWWKVWNGENGGKLKFETGNTRQYAILQLNSAGYYGPFEMHCKNHDDCYLIGSNGSDGTIIDGIEFYGSSQTKYYYAIAMSGSNAKGTYFGDYRKAVIKNCIFHEVRRAAIFLAVGRITVENNYFYAVSYPTFNFIRITEGTSIKIQNNMFEYQEIGSSSEFIEITTSFDEKNTNHIIQNNHFKCSSSSADPVFKFSEGAKAQVSGHKIMNNIIEGDCAAGNYVVGGSLDCSSCEYKDNFREFSNNLMQSTSGWTIINDLNNQTLNNYGNSATKPYPYFAQTQGIYGTEYEESPTIYFDSTNRNGNFTMGPFPPTVNCSNSLHNPRDNCDSCTNSVLSFPECLDCSNSLHDVSTDCSTCILSELKYPECDTCINNTLHDPQDSCQSCLDSDYIFPNCTEIYSSGSDTIVISLSFVIVFIVLLVDFC